MHILFTCGIKHSMSRTTTKNQFRKTDFWTGLDSILKKLEFPPKARKKTIFLQRNEETSRSFEYVRKSVKEGREKKKKTFKILFTLCSFSKQSKMFFCLFVCVGLEQWKKFKVINYLKGLPAFLYFDFLDKILNWIS